MITTTTFEEVREDVEDKVTAPPDDVVQTLLFSLMPLVVLCQSLQPKNVTKENF